MSALAVHPNGSHVLSGDWTGFMKLWREDTDDVRTLRLKTGWMIPEIHSAAWDSAETKLISASNITYVRVWNRTGQEMGGHPSPAPCRAVAYSPDGSLVAIGNDVGEVVLFHSADSTAFFQRAVHRGRILGVRIDSTGRTLATASADSTVKLWSIPDMTEQASLAGHRGAVEAIEFSPAEGMLASSGEDGTIRLWDVASGGARGVLGTGVSSIDGIAFDPHGRRLVSVSRSGVIQIWDVARLERLMTFANSGVRLRAVAWSSDGTRIATGGNDALVRLHDTASGRLITSLHGHVSAITSLRFGRRDAFLTSTAMDGTVRIWTAGPLL